MTKKYFITSDEYFKIHGQMLEILRRFRKEEGCFLSPEKTEIALQNILMGKFKDVYQGYEKALMYIIGPNNCFMPGDWLEYFDISLTEYPHQLDLPIPFKILFELLESPCPFITGKRIKETHYLMFIPRKINTEHLNIKKWKQIHLTNQKGNYLFDNNEFNFTYKFDGINTEAVAEKKWYLAFKGILPGSENKTWFEQKAMLPENYYLPKIIELIPMHFITFEKSIPPIEIKGWCGRTADTVSDYSGNQVALSLFDCPDQRPHYTISVNSRSPSLGLFVFREINLNS